MRRLLSHALAVLLLLSAAPRSLAEPDYAAVGLFALPWACGEGHAITWDPAGHWEANKASGLAYDFRMLTGTPLYAPADGLARFARDDRPFETNLGNYVDLVTLDGNWLIRMAHLRDAQEGERQVCAGDLLGYSGASGVQAEHLHMEIFAKSEKGWAPPEQSRLSRLFGLPRAEFFEGAMLTNDTCSTALVVEGQVTSLDPQAVLGGPQRLAITLRNDSLQRMRFDWLQVSLFSPLGLAQAAGAEGDWEVAPRESLTVQIPAMPEAAGQWYVGRVTLRSEGRVAGQPATGTLAVAPSELNVRAVAPTRAVYAVGARIAAQVWLHNAGPGLWQADDLLLEGVRPDGAPWEASLGEPLSMAPGESRVVTLHATFVPHEVGLWRAQHVRYTRGEQHYVLADANAFFGVAGLQLALERIRTVTTGDSFVVVATLRNVGSVIASADRIEAWGWRQDGETSFVGHAALRALAPGESALVTLVVEDGTATEEWRLVDVGYWLQGHYFSAGLPRYVDKAAGDGAPASLR